MGYENWYAAVSRPFRSKGARRFLDVLDRGLVYLIAAGYVCVLAWMAATGDARLPRALLVPAATFALVTVLRNAIDKPRPYVAHDIDPLLVKDRTGKSFPSRHVSSAVVIACTLLWVSPWLGVPALAACAVVCFTRIVGGVHYPVDVAAAAVIAAVCAGIGFLL